jgi:hypothetical protein
MSKRFIVVLALALTACGDASGVSTWMPGASHGTNPDAGADDAASAPGSLDAGTAVEASTRPPTGEDGGASRGCGGATVCDDFERAPVGALPPGWTLSTPSCSGKGAVAVDDSQAHSGARSIKVTGAGGYCDHAFFASAAIVALRPVAWLRFFVRLESPLGDGHTTFVAMKTQHDGKDLRMGGQNRVLMMNRESDDATLPSMSPAGTAQSVALTAARWTCIETEIDQATRTVRTWVDGAAIAGLVEDGVPTAEIDAAWLTQGQGPLWVPDVVDARFGWESYAGQTQTLWFDDVAIGSARIGCGL